MNELSLSLSKSYVKQKPLEDMYRNEAIFWRNCAVLIRYNRDGGSYLWHQIKADVEIGLLVETFSVDPMQYLRKLSKLDGTVPVLRKVCKRASKIKIVAYHVLEGFLRMKETYTERYRKEPNHKGYIDLYNLANDVRGWMKGMVKCDLKMHKIYRTQIVWENLHVLSSYDLNGTQNYKEHQIKLVDKTNVLVSTATWDKKNWLGMLTELPETVKVIRYMCEKAKEEKPVIDGMKRMAKTYEKYWSENDPQHPGLAELLKLREDF